MRLKDSTQKIAGFLYKNSTAKPLTARHTAEVCIICHLLCLPGNFLFSDSGMYDGITSIPPIVHWGTLSRKSWKLFRPGKLFYVCRVGIQRQSLNTFDNDTMKLSVHKAKLSGL